MGFLLHWSRIDLFRQVWNVGNSGIRGDINGLKLVVNGVTLTTVNIKPMFCKTSNDNHYFSYKER